MQTYTYKYPLQALPLPKKMFRWTGLILVKLAMSRRLTATVKSNMVGDGAARHMFTGNKTGSLLSGYVKWMRGLFCAL